MAEISKKEMLRRIAHTRAYEYEVAVRAFRRVTEKVPYRFNPDENEVLPTAEELTTALGGVEAARTRLAEAIREYREAGGEW